MSDYSYCVTYFCANFAGNCAHMRDIAAAEPGRLRKPLCGGGWRSSWGRDVAAAAAAPRRRVLQEEQVPNAEKIYSIFEPHTDLIMRGKVRTPVEFGHKVFLAESAQGLITQYEVLNGNPSDENHVEPSLSRHEATFGSAPRLYGSDRGFFSEKNLAACERSGVAVVCIPQRGGKKTAEREAYEKSREFKNGQRFRAGIEGRISVLFRGRGMKRCLAEGRERFELLVGAAVFVNNLLIIASLLKRRSSDQRQAA